MQKVLAALKDSGDLCEIYSDTHSNSHFDVGRIYDYDGDYVMFWELTPTGESNGIRILDLEDVYMIQTDTRYLDKVKILTLQQNPREERLDFGGQDILHGALEYVRDSGKICSMEVGYPGGGGACGKIISLDGDIVAIEVIDIYGKSDGTAYVSEDDIVSLSVDSQREMALKKIKIR